MNDSSEVDPYKKFIARHQEWIFGLPDSEYLLPLLKLRFTADEAEFLSELPFLPHDLDKIALKLNLNAEEVEKKLDAFAQRGLVTRYSGKSSVKYALADSILMFYRMPGWKGEVNEWDKEIAPHQNHYYIDVMAKEFLEHPTKGLRAVPINKTIKHDIKIMPYEDILKIIDNVKDFTVSTCNCRHIKNLDPEFDDCKHETFNCLHFDGLGKYIVENGLGKEITKEETLDILAKAADAGLVHGVSNTKERIDTICNCCSCCCIFLQNMVKMPAPIPRGHQVSNYIRGIDEEKCVACGVCANFCPMLALTLEENKIQFDDERCIGCGVCVHKCPENAITLTERDEEVEIPNDPRDLAIRLLKERGRDIKNTFEKNTI